MYIHVDVYVSYLCKSVGYLLRLVSRAGHDENLGSAHNSGPLCYAYTNNARESDQSQKSLNKHSFKKMSNQLLN